MATELSYVFVSYSHRDKATVDVLVRALQDRDIPFRFDQDLVAGDAWQEQLRQWLDDAGVVLVVWSPRSASSTNVLSEAARARERLVPVALTGIADVPDLYQELHTFDLSAWSGDPGASILDELSRVLRSRLASFAAPRGHAVAGEEQQERTPGDVTASQPGTADAPKPWYRRMPVWVGTIVAGPLIVGVILAFVNGFAARIIGGSAPTVSPLPIQSQSASQHASTLSTAPPAVPTGSHSASPTSASSSLNPSPSAAPVGTITSPPSGASGVTAHKNLRLSGTAQGIPSGYRLDLFLQFANSGNGIRYYIAADPNSAITLQNGRWAAPIFIGDSGSIIIRLVMLSFSQIVYVNSHAAYQSSGFPSLPGITLASASYTAQ
jgi:hypothetical protein